MIITLPKQATKVTEKSLNDFEKYLRSRQLGYQNNMSISNLTPRQWKTAEGLTANDDHLVIECDKNLGATILVSGHLGNTRVYQRLSEITSCDTGSICSQVSGRM